MAPWNQDLMKGTNLGAVLMPPLNQLTTGGFEGCKGVSRKSPGSFWMNHEGHMSWQVPHFTVNPSFSRNFRQVFGSSGLGDHLSASGHELTISIQLTWTQNISPMNPDLISFRLHIGERGIICKEDPNPVSKNYSFGSPKTNPWRTSLAPARLNDWTSLVAVKFDTRQTTVRFRKLLLSS